MPRVLIVDDDTMITSSVEQVLKAKGFLVDAVNYCPDAEGFLASYDYDLIILDWMMPDKLGIDFLAELRARGFTTPVLMLTGMSEIKDKVQGLETGADDYLPKPFEKVELLARINAIMRRPRTLVAPELNLSGVSLNMHSQRVTWQGQDLKLTKQEYRLLEILMRNKNRVFTYESLVDQAWSAQSDSASPESVRTHVARLRKKFDESVAPCPIRTVHGQGYLFAVDEAS